MFLWTEWSAEGMILAEMKSDHKWQATKQDYLTAFPFTGKALQAKENLFKIGV